MAAAVAKARAGESESKSQLRRRGEVRVVSFPAFLQFAWNSGNAYLEKKLELHSRVSFLGST
jgi:hypothetical protein